MEYYGSYAASTTPLPNIYRQQHRRHKSTSARGDTALGVGTGSPSSSSSITATADLGSDRKSTSTRSVRHARTSSSSEFSSRSRSSHGRPPLPFFLSRADTTSGTSSNKPIKEIKPKTPNKIKRKSSSRSQQQQEKQQHQGQQQPPLPFPKTQQLPPPPFPPPSTKPPPPPTISSPSRPPPLTPTLKSSKQTPVARGAAEPSSPLLRAGPPTTPQAARSSGARPSRAAATLVPSEANHLSEVQQYRSTSPASPSFPSAYLPNLNFLPSHPPRTSSVTALTIGAASLTRLSVTPAGAPTDATTATTATTVTATPNAGGGINSGHEPVPPLPPPKALQANPPASPSPNYRMLANTGKQVEAKHQKQLPALPPPLLPPQPAYAAPLPPLPRSVAVAQAAAAAAAAAADSPSPSATSTQHHYHHYHSHPRPQPSPSGIEDRQQHHAAMTPEPGTPNPSASSSSFQQPPQLPLQPQVLSRFNVPFGRTESVVSSASAATTLSSRTMQSSNPPSASTEDVSSRLFVVRNGRTYLNDPTLPYPLPVDLCELHRQSLHTLLLFQLFGGPVCSPAFQSKPPSRVLEVGCGSGFWSMMCHRYFVRHGHSNISFTGVDIAPLSSSNSSGGGTQPDGDMRWRFVQHDLRRTPWPFQDAEFDLIMLKDMSLATSTKSQQSQMDEVLRLLRPGGTLEIWESDHTIRMLRPHMPIPLAEGEDEDLDHAESLGAYVMTANTPLSAPLNNYLVEYNSWISRALDSRSISTVPCTTMGPMLLQESELLVDVRSRRLAVPLSEMRWECEGVGGVVTKDGKSYIETKGKSRDIERRAPLSAGQIALRRTALLTVVQMIQSLELVLREVSGKSQDEWDGWAGKMMSDLMGGGTAWGECLEVGAWWAKKRT